MTTPTVEISECSCAPADTVREILEQINQSRHLFRVVIADDGKLLGTVTDGDLRRAMLQDVGLDAPIVDCMQVDPVVGFVGQDEDNSLKLRSLGSTRAFLPVLDADGILVQVLSIRRPKNFGIRAALVMAGGFGQRLGAKTKNTPKPLCPLVASTRSWPGCARTEVWQMCRRAVARR